MANTSMAVRQTIHDEMRAGRITPDHAATLLELRGELEVTRDRIALRNSPLAQLVVLLGAVVLALLGVRRDG